MGVGTLLRQAINMTGPAKVRFSHRGSEARVSISPSVTAALVSSPTQDGRSVVMWLEELAGYIPFDSGSD